MGIIANAVSSPSGDASYPSELQIRQTTVLESARGTADNGANLRTGCSASHIDNTTNGCSQEVPEY